MQKRMYSLSSKIILGKGRVNQMEEKEMYQRKAKILVAVDGSENSIRALKEAKNYAKEMEAELTILTVLEQKTPRHYSMSGKEIAYFLEKQEETGNKVLEEAVGYFKNYEAPVHSLLKKGDPANEILKVIDSVDFNLVIMGNRGLGAFTRTLLGSVSNKIVNHSDTNVLIVR